MCGAVGIPYMITVMRHHLHTVQLVSVPDINHTSHMKLGEEQGHACMISASYRQHVGRTSTTIITPLIPAAAAAAFTKGEAHILPYQ